MKRKHAKTIIENLDVNDKLSFIERLHLLMCRECRAEYYEVKKLHKAAKGSSPYDAPFTTDMIMEQIPLREFSALPKQISDVIWFICGLPLILGGIVLPFSGGFLWAQLMLGTHYQIITFLIFGILITVYSILFVIAHYQKFENFLSQDHMDVLHKGLRRH